MKNFSARRLPRSLAFALLAIAPVVTEHAIFRSLTKRKIENELLQEIEQRVELADARVRILVERCFARATSIANDRFVEKLLQTRESASLEQRQTDQFAITQRLFEFAQNLEPGAVARIVDPDGRIVASSIQGDITDARGMVRGAVSVPGDQPIIRGLSRIGSANGLEFYAPVRQANDTIRNNSGTRFGATLWIPETVLSRTCAELITNDHAGARFMIFDQYGLCLADTQNTQVHQKSAPTGAAEIESWQLTKTFGQETESIVQATANVPGISGILRNYLEREIRVRIRAIPHAKIELLYILPGDTSRPDFTTSDRVVVVISFIVGVATFLYSYYRSQRVATRFESSMWPPVLAGATVFIVICGSTLYATRAIDEKGRESARSFARLVQKSLVDDLQSAIATRLAYFERLDDRMISAMDPRADFINIERPARETFPEGVLALWPNLDDPEREPMRSNPDEIIDFHGSASLPEGKYELERPRVILESNSVAGLRVVLDAPFRNRENNQLGRLAWKFELNALCASVFSTARTSGFDVYVVRDQELARSVAPFGIQVPPDAYLSSQFRIPFSGAEEFRLALRPNMDLFGKQTSRTLVLYIGMLLACGGAVSMGLVVNALGIYRRASRVDPLTGLYNRIEFDEMLAREVSRAERHGRSLTLAMIDLDHFKQVNDTFGHTMGDDVLKRVSEELKRLTRAGDTIFRHGGEEFAVVLPETPEEAALIVIERVRESFARHSIADAVGPITFSCGVAEWDGAETTDAFIARADAALYQAKRHGRNRVLSAQVIKIAESLQMAPAIG